MSERTGEITGADEDVRRRARDLLLGVVEPAVFGLGRPLAISAHHLRGEPVSPAEALRRMYEPFAVGDAWDRAGTRPGSTSGAQSRPSGPARTWCFASRRCGPARRSPAASS